MAARLRAVGPEAPDDIRDLTATLATDISRLWPPTPRTAILATDISRAWPPAPQTAILTAAEPRFTMITGVAGR